MLCTWKCVGTQSRDQPSPADGTPSSRGFSLASPTSSSAQVPQVGLSRP